MLGKKKLGFTLVEVMITVLIFSALIGAIFTVLTTGRTAWMIGETQIDLQQNLRRGLDWITGELREAGASQISNGPEDADDVWHPTISFKKPQDVVGGSIVWESDEIQYLLGGLNGKQLLRKVGSEEKILANNIASFQVRR